MNNTFILNNSYKTVLIFVLFVCITTVVCSHPLHFSVTNIEYDKQTGEFHISIKLFKDDVESIIYHKYGKNVNINENTLEGENKSIIHDYINEHFRISVDNEFTEQYPLDINKLKIEDNSLWLYLSIHDQKKNNILFIRNSLLMDIFHDQTNLVFLITGDDELAHKYSIDNYTVKYNLSSIPDED